MSNQEGIDRAFAMKICRALTKRADGKQKHLNSELAQAMMKPFQRSMLEHEEHTLRSLATELGTPEGLAKFFEGVE